MLQRVGAGRHRYLSCCMGTQPWSGKRWKAGGGWRGGGVEGGRWRGVCVGLGWWWWCLEEKKNSAWPLCSYVDPIRSLPPDCLRAAHVAALPALPALPALRVQVRHVGGPWAVLYGHPAAPLLCATLLATHGPARTPGRVWATGLGAGCLSAAPLVVGGSSHLQVSFGTVLWCMLGTCKGLPGRVQGVTERSSVGGSARTGERWE